MLNVVYHLTESIYYNLFLQPLSHDLKYDNLIIIVSTSLSRPVSHQRTEKLTTTMKHKKHVHVYEVPRFSLKEHHIMLAHYECIGLGKLRFDKGKVLGDVHEVHFLYMISAGIGRLLLNAVIL